MCTGRRRILTHRKEEDTYTNFEKEALSLMCIVKCTRALTFEDTSMVRRRIPTHI
jgi:hypothetical protein